MPSLARNTVTQLWPAGANETHDNSDLEAGNAVPVAETLVPYVTLKSRLTAHPATATDYVAGDVQRAKTLLRGLLDAYGTADSGLIALPEVMADLEFTIDGLGNPHRQTVRLAEATAKRWGINTEGDASGHHTYIRYLAGETDEFDFQHHQKAIAAWAPAIGLLTASEGTGASSCLCVALIKRTHDHSQFSDSQIWNVVHTTSPVRMLCPSKITARQVASAILFTFQPEAVRNACCSAGSDVQYKDAEPLTAFEALLTQIAGPDRA